MSDRCISNDAVAIYSGMFSNMFSRTFSAGFRHASSKFPACFLHISGRFPEKFPACFQQVSNMFLAGFPAGFQQVSAKQQPLGVVAPIVHREIFTTNRRNPVSRMPITRTWITDTHSGSWAQSCSVWRVACSGPPQTTAPTRDRHPQNAGAGFRWERRTRP